MVQVSSFEGFDEELLTRQQGDIGQTAYAEIEPLATPLDVRDAGHGASRVAQACDTRCFWSPEKCSLINRLAVCGVPKGRRHQLLAQPLVNKRAFQGRPGAGAAQVHRGGTQGWGGCQRSNIATPRSFQLEAGIAALNST